MINHSIELENKIKSGNFTKRVKIELLNKDEIVIDTITPDIIDGNISVDKDRDITRTFSLTMANINNKYTAGMGNTIWLDKKIKPYIGIELPGGIEWIPQGVFVLTKPVMTVSVGQVPTTRIECVDKTYKWGKIRNNLSIAKNVKVTDAIQLVLDGFETKFLFDDCDYTVPYTLNYNSGTERKKIIKDLVDMITWYIGYDVYGYLRLKPFTDPENGVVTWTYKHENYTLYSGSEKVIDDTELYNVVTVVGGSSQTATVSATAEDNDLLSPFSTVNIGERLFQYNNGSPDPLITTTELAMIRANYELKKKLQYVEKQTITIIPNFLHEEGDCIVLDEPGTETNNQKYELLRFNIPLKNESTTTAEVWKTKRLL